MEKKENWYLLTLKTKNYIKRKRRKKEEKKEVEGGYLIDKVTLRWMELVFIRNKFVEFVQEEFSKNVSPIYLQIKENIILGLLP